MNFLILILTIIISTSAQLQYETLIDLTHHMYSSQIIIKAKPLNKITTTTSKSFSVLLQIEAVYKNNNENKNFNLASATTASASNVVFTKVFLQNITLPIIKTSQQQQQQTNNGDMLLNKSYILFLNKNHHHQQQQQQQQHDFYTLVNLKQNRYIRERVPKLALFSTPIEWNELSENFLVNSLCKACGN